MADFDVILEARRLQSVVAVLIVLMIAGLTVGLVIGLVGISSKGNFNAAKHLFINVNNYALFKTIMLKSLKFC